MRTRSVLATLVTACLTGTLAAGAHASGTAAPDARVQITGTLLRTAVETPGGKEWFAIRTKEGIVPVTATKLTGIAPHSTVTVDVTVPDTIADAAGDDRTITLRVGGDPVRHDLSQGDLDAATDATPASAGSAIGRATTDAPLVPGAAPLTVGTVTSVKPTAAAYTPATRRITYLEVTPRGVVRDGPVTSAQATAHVAGADAFWRDNSRSTLRVGAPTVRAHYTSPYGCADDPFALWSHAAERVGWSPADNASLVLVLPRDAYNRGCSWGLGTIGTGPNDWGLVYSSSLSVHTLAHELGHNMSFGHADSLSCTGRSDASLSTSTGRWASGCLEEPYGDYLDVMGPDVNRPPAMLSSPQALRVGTLESTARTTVGTGTTNVTLRPLSGRTGLRTAVVRNAANGVSYYVEYRTASGRDSGVATHHQAPGVRVLRYNSHLGTSVVLDPTPTGGRDGDMALTAGRTLTSYDGRITVTTLSTSASQALVRIANHAEAMPFVRRTSPTITGTRGVGKTLTATKGTWSPTPSSYTYRWRRNGTAISGATRSTYTPTTADAGRYLTVTVTPRRTGYTSTGATSARVGIPIHATTRPSITGTLRPGRTLTVMVGAWTPRPSSYAYQWYRGGKKISGATAKTYTVRSADRGQRIQARVTARRSGYSTGAMFTYSKVIPR